MKKNLFTVNICWKNNLYQDPEKRETRCSNVPEFFNILLLANWNRKSFLVMSEIANMNGNFCERESNQAETQTFNIWWNIIWHKF